MPVMPLSSAAAVLVSVALAAGGLTGAPIDDSRLADTPVGGDPRISLTVVNWGEPATLLDPARPAWAHLAANAAPTTLTVTVRADGEAFRGGYALRLTAPDAFGGEAEFVCADQYRVIESAIRCSFPVPITRGVNDIHVVFQSGDMDEGIEAHGQIRGAELDVVSIVEVKDPNAGWFAVRSGSEVQLFGALTSSLRYRLLNTGDIPFRLTSGGCQSGTVYPDQQLLCTLRGPRPAYALAGDYVKPIRLEDPAGGQAAFDLEASVRVAGVPVISR